MKTLFAALAFAFSVAAYWPYTRSVLESKARPTLSAWMSWGLMDVAILAGMIAAEEVAWQMVAYVFGVSFVIGAAIYKKATLGWKRLDTICMTIVVSAIGLWAVTGDPEVAIALSLVAVTVGSIPAIVNVWNDPAREPRLPWVLIGIGGACGVLAVTKWSIAGAATQVWFFVFRVVFLSLIYRRELQALRF